MTEIRNLKIYDLKESIIASGLAMRISPCESYFEEFLDNSKKHLKRCIKLVNASKNSDVHCHDNFLTGIRVSFDIKYPQYLSPEIQRYHFLDIVTSMSKMHRLFKLDLKTCCNKYVSSEVINASQKYIDDYKKALESNSEDTYDAFMRMVSNCPLGLELWMRVSTNYKQLQTIYYQRRHHRLKEDWGAIITMIEDLPYFKELILGNNETME